MHNVNLYKYKHMHIFKTNTVMAKKISAPLVNMIKDWKWICLLLILLIFYKKESQKSNLSLDNKNLKWGGGVSIWINVFSNTRWTQLLTPLEILMSKISEVYSIHIHNLSTPGWLWTWNYPAMASCFTEI